MGKGFACLLMPIVLGGLAAVVTYGRPADLLCLLAFNRGFHDGHFTGYWIAQLDSPNGLVRCRAIRALGAIGPDAADSVPRLAEILRHDPNWGPRCEAALALMRMGPAAAEAAPALGEALADVAPRVRMNAAFALIQLGKGARPAVPALIEALRDGRNRTRLGVFHHTIRETAAIALGRAGGGAEAVKALAEALAEAQTPEARRAMAHALGEVGPAARPAAGLLRGLLRATEEERQAAEEALRRIGGDGGA